MGNLCDKTKQKDSYVASENNNNQAPNETLKTQIHKDVTFKTCGKGEFEVWLNLHERSLLKLKSIDKKTKNVEFNFSDIDYHDLVFFGQVVYAFEKQDNFLLFPLIFNILISIVDFIQLVLELKRKNQVNEFFLIYFNKFLFEKDSKRVSRIKYICTKLNEAYDNPELLFTKDNLISSISIVDTSKSFLNQFKYDISANKEEEDVEPDINSYFYTKAQKLYTELRNKKFNFNDFEYFYSEIIMNFINRFLLKKTSVSIQDMNHDLTPVKNNLRNCFKELRKEQVGLQQLKEFLTSFYYNNLEMVQLTAKINDCLSRTQITEINETYQKIMEIKKMELNFEYGKCITNSSKGHSISFIYDTLIEPNKHEVCVKCAWDLIFKVIKKENQISLEELETEISSKKDIKIDFFYIIKYICFLHPISSNSIGNASIDQNESKGVSEILTRKTIGLQNFQGALKADIIVTTKQNLTAKFEILRHDEDDAELFEPINYDLKIKDILANKYNNDDKSLLYNSNIGDKDFRFSKQSKENDFEENNSDF